MNQSAGKQYEGLKKNRLKPHRTEYWCIPAKAEPEFVACMEDFLDVYELPYNPQIPVVCMDEKPYQLLGEAKDSWAMRPGNNKKVDSEYIQKWNLQPFCVH